MKAPPFPVALVSIIQASFGFIVAASIGYSVTTSGLVDIGDVPAWIVPLGIPAGLASVVSAVQLWRLRWSGPISFAFLWLLPLVASLPFASVIEIISDASYIEGRIAFLLVYAVIVFEFRKQFAPKRSSKPNPLRGSA